MLSLIIEYPVNYYDDRKFTNAVLGNGESGNVHDEIELSTLTVLYNTG